MLTHYLKVAFRNLMKYKLQTAISVVSLAVGIAIFSISAQWLHYEKSFDTFHKEADKIYLLRAYSEHTQNNYSVCFRYDLAPLLQAKYPAISDITRASDRGWYDISYLDNVIKGQHVMCVDDNFGNFFDVKVLKGKKTLALNDDEIAITETLASYMFGDKLPIGQMVNLDGLEYKVVSVVENPKTPTSFPYDILAPYPFMNHQLSWLGNDAKYDATCYHHAYVLCKVASSNYSSLIDKFHENYQAGDYTGDDFRDYEYLLVPITQIREVCPLRDSKVELDHLRLFILMGGVVILCSLFNYFSIIASRVRIRQRELVLRCVNGARIYQNVLLVASEIGIVLLLAVTLSTLCLAAIVPSFIEELNVPLGTNDVMIRSFIVSLIAAVVSLVILFIVVYICCTRGVRSIVDTRLKATSFWGYKFNVCSQLAVSICAIFCTLVMILQIRYMMYSTDMGWDKHNLVYFGQRTLDKAAINKVLSGMPEIEDFGAYWIPPIEGYHLYDCKYECHDEAGDVNGSFYYSRADEKSFELMGFQLLKGEFLKDGDMDVVVVTEALAKQLGGAEAAIGRQLHIQSIQKTVTVKGVIKDIMSERPIDDPDPMALFPTPSKDSYEWFNFEAVRTGYMFVVRYKDGVDGEEFQRKLTRAIRKISKDDDVWGGSYEKNYEEYLESEYALLHFLILTTVICVFIAVFGIFGVVTLSCEKRRKEIAIRKINGAKRNTILAMFVKEYMLLMLIASCLAMPVGFYLMHLWMMQYGKHISYIMLLLIPVIMIVMAAIIYLTIFWQVWKVARTNPAEVVKE